MFDKTEADYDFGMGYFGKWYGWSPDRDLNPQYDGIPDIERSLLHISCPHGDKGGGGLHPDTPDVRKVFKEGPHWQVVSWEPLTLSPSILMRSCGCHGFIRDGKWVPA